MSEENKPSENAQKVEIDAKTLEFLKSKADDMDKYKSELKELKKTLEEKLPAGEQKPVKDQILELLKEKEETKTEAQLLAEQLAELKNSFDTEVGGLKSQLEQEKAEKLRMATENAIKAKATEMKFQNPDLVLKLIDMNGDVEAQLTQLAETQSYLIKQESKNINQQTNFTAPPNNKAEWTVQDYIRNAPLIG